MISPYHFKLNLFSTSGFGFIGMLLLLMLASLGASTVYLLTTPPLATQRLKKTNDRAAALRTAITLYQNSHGGATGTYPPALSSLITTDGVACTANNTPASPLYLTLQGWCGPYIDIVFVEDSSAFKTDAWGTDFTFNSTTGVLTSSGPDRTYGNSDDLTF